MTTFLPIVGRELRVAARRGTAHWTRFALTLVVGLVVLPNFFSSATANPSVIGRSAFEWLSGAAFVLACGACALTADALSAEHREGTLGFLFLTDLRPADVTLGKLASAGLGAAYAGIAFVPLLMMPVLAGGVSGQEAARTGIALLGTLSFALASGLAASANNTDRVIALRGAAAWMLGIVIVPALFGPAALSLQTLSWLSPLTTLQLAQDTAYRAHRLAFWVSLSLQLLLATLLLVRAGVCLRRSLTAVPVEKGRTRFQRWRRDRLRRSLAGARVQPVPEPPPRPVALKPYSTDWASNASYALANRPAPPRLRRPRPLNEARPVEWLVRRQRGQGTVCWVAAFLLMASNYLPGLFSAFLFRIWRPTGSTLPLIWYVLTPLAWVGLALLAWAASRFFFEARRSGELELLLTTPVGAQAAVSAHWAAMKRLLRGPVLMLIVAPVAIQFAYYWLFGWPGLGRVPLSMRWYSVYSNLRAVLDVGAILLQVAALNWLGMYFGLTLRRQINAVAMTCALVVGLPLLLNFPLRVIIGQFTGPGVSATSGIFWYLSFYPIQYALLVVLTRWARKRLLQGALNESGRVDWRHDPEAIIQQFAAAIRSARRWRTG